MESYKASLQCEHNVLLDILAKQIDDVINTTTNILREMNYHIAHVLSFCAGYNISIIS